MKKASLFLILSSIASLNSVNFITKTYFKICNNEKKEEQLNNAVKFGIEYRLKAQDLQELSELAPNATIAQNSFNRLLASACRNNNLELVKFSIEKGADVNTKIDGFSLPLLEAAAAFFKQRIPNTEILQFLINKEANLDNFNSNHHYDLWTQKIIKENLQLTKTNSYQTFINFVNKNSKVFEKLDITTVKNLSTTQKVVKTAGQFLLKRWGF